MSDSSDSSTASDASMNDISNGSDVEFYGHAHNDQEEWSDFDDASEEDPDPVNDDDDAKMQNISRLVLCSKHKQGQMLHTCPSCSAALTIISDKRIIEKLFLNTDTESAGASLLSRYSGRCDAVEPTLVLDPFTVKVAASIFNKGVWNDSRMWSDIIKQFLRLPLEQHELLTSNLQSEEILNKFRRDSRFKGIFKYQTELAKSLNDLRIGQRPLFMLMERLNNDISKLRAFAAENGIEFPETDPPRKGANVPRTGRTVPDKLHYESSENIFPYPEISGYVQKHNLSQEAEMDLRNLFEDYRSRAGGKLMDLYDMFSSCLNASDDFLIFYFDLLSHIDATLRELIRDKVASLFKKEIKSEILSQSSSKKNKDENHVGYFGGDKKLKSVLSDATKKSTILDKAVIPPRKSSVNHKDSKYGPNSRPRSRSRSRSRSPDRNKDTGSRKYSSRYSKKKKPGNGSVTKESRDPKPRKQKSGSSKR